jgi:proteasome lid subunit RPN8/RPN11
MAIEIDDLDLIKIKQYGEISYPNESCGLLIGKRQNGLKKIYSIFPAENAREEESQYHRFLITPQTFLEGQKFAEKQNSEVIGFYHSHPDSEAEPSVYDREHAWPWYSYIIVSVRKNTAERITSWVLEEDRSKFSEEEIKIIQTGLEKK